MKSKAKIIIAILILTALVTTGCSRDNYDAAKITINSNKIKVRNSDSVEVDENTIIINEGGEYLFSGSGENISIIVDSSDNVKIILDGLEIVNDDYEVIKSKSKGKITINSIGISENRLTVNNAEKNACIESDGDVEISGDATLVLYGYTCVDADKELIISAPMQMKAMADGIKADEIILLSEDFYISAYENAIKADDIVIESGTYSIKGTGAESQGLNSKDDIEIISGDIIIDTIGDGIHAKDHIIISDGDIFISTEDDAIYAKKSIVIDGGDILIDRCVEGIESGLVTINGGKIDITSQNDGINGAFDEKDSKKSADVYVNGGEIIIDAYGDGIDANGSIFINGGVLFVCGAYGGDDNAIDFDDELVINGGVVMAAGNNLKAKPPSKDSLQNSIMIIFDNKNSNDKAFAIAGESNEILFAADFIKPYDCVIFTSDKIKNGGKYYYCVLKDDVLNNEYLLNVKTEDYSIDYLDGFEIFSNVTMVRK